MVWKFASGYHLRPCNNPKYQPKRLFSESKSTPENGWIETRNPICRNKPPWLQKIQRFGGYAASDFQCGPLVLFGAAAATFPYGTYLGSQQVPQCKSLGQATLSFRYLAYFHGLSHCSSMSSLPELALRCWRRALSLKYGSTPELALYQWKWRTSQSHLGNSTGIEGFFISYQQTPAVSAKFRNINTWYKKSQAYVPLCVQLVYRIIIFWPRTCPNLNAARASKRKHRTSWTICQKDLTGIALTFALDGLTCSNFCLIYPPSFIDFQPPFLVKPLFYLK